MHYDLIIVTETKPDNIDINHLWVNKASVFNNYIITKESKYTYDYLIIDKLYNELNLLTEDGLIITNQFFQTTNEYIYAVGKAVNSKMDFNQQIQTVIENIKEPF